jgi:hypothetical protein
VDDDGAVVEGILFNESKYFRGTLRINSFRKMNDERLTCRSGFLPSEQIVIQRHRMGPREIAKHADGEPLVEDLRDVGVVMAHGGNTAEKIANPAPPEANVFVDSSMLAYRGGFGLMNVVGPLYKVAVSAFAESWEQCEFEVIVSIHETWEQKKAAQVDAVRVLFRLSRRSCSI